MINYIGAISKKASFIDPNSSVEGELDQLMFSDDSNSVKDIDKINLKLEEYNYPARIDEIQSKENYILVILDLEGLDESQISAEKKKFEIWYEQMD